MVWPALLASLLCFFAVGAHSLRQPGLQYDEAFDAIPAIEVLQGARPRCADSTRLFGPDLPLMMHPHIGPTTIYTSLAGFELLGVSVESLRLSQLVVGALALLLLALLARAWFDARTAALAVLLCGSAPVFIWWSRGGANWTVPLLPLALGALLALTRWWRRRGTAALALTGFLLGLGITTKILFVWLALPMVLTGLLAIGPREIVRVLRRTPRHTIAIALVAFLVGLAPLIAHNLPEPHTFEHIARSSVTTAWGHDNRNFLANAVLAAGSFLSMMDGEVLMNGPDLGYRLGGEVLGLAILYGAAVTLWSLRRPTRPPAGCSARVRDQRVARTFLLLVPLTVVPQSAITTSAISSTYVFLIVPFAWLLVAVMVADALALACSEASLPSRRLLAGGIGVALVSALLASHLASNLGLLRFFDQTGGRGQWSDAVYRTTEVLEREYPSRRVIALDWGLARSIEFLTVLRRRITEGHEFLPAPSKRYPETVRGLLAEPGTILLAHAEDFAICRGCLAVVEQVAREDGIDLTLRHVIRDGEGRPHTTIYEVGDTTSAPGSTSKMNTPPSAYLNARCGEAARSAASPGSPRAPR